MSLTKSQLTWLKLIYYFLLQNVATVSTRFAIKKRIAITQFAINIKNELKDV